MSQHRRQPIGPPCRSVTSHCSATRRSVTFDGPKTTTHSRAALRARVRDGRRPITQVQMAAGRPSLKTSGWSGIEWAWPRATRRALQAAAAACRSRPPQSDRRRTRRRGFLARTLVEYGWTGTPSPAGFAYWLRRPGMRMSPRHPRLPQGGTSGGAGGDRLLQGCWAPWASTYTL